LLFQPRGHGVLHAQPQGAGTDHDAAERANTLGNGWKANVLVFQNTDFWLWKKGRNVRCIIPLLRHFSLPFMVKIDVNILSSLLFIVLLGEICRRQVKYALWRVLLGGRQVYFNARMWWTRGHMRFCLGSNTSIFFAKMFKNIFHQSCLLILANYKTYIQIRILQMYSQF
jgi:hypothetical protein